MKVVDVILYIFHCHCWYRVEPLKNGHFGDEHFVHCCPLFGDGNVKAGGQTVCPLYGGCPLFRVSIIRGSTVACKAVVFQPGKVHHYSAESLLAAVWLVTVAIILVVH